jgi:hypothetical protein
MVEMTKMMGCATSLEVDDKDIKKYDMCVKVDDEGAKRKRTPRG